MSIKMVRVKELQEEIEWLNCQLENYRSTDKKINALPNIIFLVKAGKLISAIKEYRDIYNETLLNSKNAVYNVRLDILRGKYGEFDVTLVAPTGAARYELEIIGG